MSENIKKDRKLLLLLIGALLGILLLIFGGVGNQKREEKTQESNVESSLDPQWYAEELERQVIALCSSVKGAGAVRAVVTLKGGYRAVYATDSKSSGTGYQNSMVLIGSGASEQAILVCYENPEIAGIGIVCSGATSAEVRQNIVALVSATLNIGTNKIYVAYGQVS